MRHSRLLPSFLIVLLAAACGGREETREEVEASIVSGGQADAAAASGDAAPPPAEPAPMTPEEVERRIAEDDALEETNRAEFERRSASMGSYQECVRDADQLPPPVRARIEAACSNRPGAP